MWEGTEQKRKSRAHGHGQLGGAGGPGPWRGEVALGKSQSID